MQPRRSRYSLSIAANLGSSSATRSSWLISSPLTASVLVAPRARSLDFAVTDPRLGTKPGRNNEVETQIESGKVLKPAAASRRPTLLLANGTVARGVRGGSGPLRGPGPPLLRLWTLVERPRASG